MSLLLNQIQKKFGDRVVIDSFTYEFKPGVRYVLRGQSGAGKSTLLNLIARFEKQSAGEIIYDGRALQTLKQTVYFRDTLGYLFQNYALLESETVAKNLNVAFNGRLKKVEKEMQMIAALHAVQLPESYLTRPIYELSGGEQQRVAIARMIIKQPKILLVDEPTAALDEATAKAILYEVLAPLSQSDTIMIVASHDPLVFEWAEATVMLNHA